MSATLVSGLPRQRLLAIDPDKFLFSLSSLLAAGATLGIAFAVSLPRPWWALLTAYVTAQPMAGAFRPKIFYRLGGIAIGATVTVLLVPNLQNSPALLVTCLALWAGVCIYLAVLDRTPRAFLFQMAAFSSAVISFPYLEDPADIFSTTIARVEEMTVAIVCMSIAHAVLQPWSAIPLIRSRAEAFLAHASRWTAEALTHRHTALEYEHRRELAADVTELGMIAIHLPTDLRTATATRRLVVHLQERLATVLPLASGAANRLDLLRTLGPLEPALANLVRHVTIWLRTAIDSPANIERELLDRCRSLIPRTAPALSWRELLTGSACARIAEFLDAHQRSRAFVQRIGGQPQEGPDGAGHFALAKDHMLPALAGLATATAIGLYCAVWIGLGWPNGNATAAFAALITCSFAAQDDPAPTIRRYLGATLVTFPVAAFYLFVVLPRVDGYAELMVMLSPVLLAMGYVQAHSRWSALALPMFSCLIVALGFLDRFQIDFAGFVNTGIAQVGGILATIAVTRLFRSVGVRWIAQRAIHANWSELVQLADVSREFMPTQWTGRAIDRLGQIAARMAVTAPDDRLHAASGLSDLRAGRNIIVIRRAANMAAPEARLALEGVLAQVSAHYEACRRRREPAHPCAGLLHSIDAAIRTVLRDVNAAALPAPVLALVGLRCNLLGHADPYSPTQP